MYRVYFIPGEWAFRDPSTILYLSLYFSWYLRIIRTRTRGRASWFLLRFESSRCEAHNHHQRQCRGLPFPSSRRGSSGIFWKGLWLSWPILWRVWIWSREQSAIQIGRFSRLPTSRHQSKSHSGTDVSSRSEHRWGCFGGRRCCRDSFRERHLSQCLCVRAEGYDCSRTAGVEIHGRSPKRSLSQSQEYSCSKGDDSHIQTCSAAATTHRLQWYLQCNSQGQSSTSTARRFQWSFQGRSRTKGGESCSCTGWNKGCQSRKIWCTGETRVLWFRPNNFQSSRLQAVGWMGAWRCRATCNVRTWADSSTEASEWFVSVSVPAQWSCDALSSRCEGGCVMDRWCFGRTLRILLSDVLRESSFGERTTHVNTSSYTHLALWVCHGSPRPNQMIQT